MNSNHPNIKLLLVCVMSVSLVSCATTAGNQRVSAARDTFDSRKTYTQGAVGGAAIGAAAGALIGGLAGGRGFNPQNAIMGAIAGGVAGAAGGTIYANEKVNQRRAYQGAEGQLSNAIAQARATRNAANNFNSVLRGEVRKLRTNAAELQGTINDSEKVLGEVNNEITRQRDVLQQSRAANVSPAERQNLMAQVNGLEGARTELQTSINRLRRKQTPVELADR